LRKYCTQTQIKRKLNKNDQNLQELWDLIKRPNLRIHAVEEGTKIQTREIKKLLIEITVENFPNLGKDVDIKYRRHLQPQIHMSIKSPLHHATLVKIPRLKA
jgi:hypothetical protein